jgi:hypothetical protein
MENPIEDIKKAGQESATFHWPTTKIQNSRFVADECQTFVLEQRANVLLDTEHPYRALQYMLGDALVMLHSAASQSTKPRCIETIKTAAAYIKRICRLVRPLVRAGAVDIKDLHTRVGINTTSGAIKELLKNAAERLSLTKNETRYLSLFGIKEVLKHPTALVEETRQYLAHFIAENPEKSTRCELANGGLSK